MRQVWVVADRFAGFAEEEGVYTTSGFARLAAGWAADGEPVTVWLGQGIGDYERGYLDGVVTRLGIGWLVRFEGGPGEPAGREVVHKHAESNVLLSDVRAAGDHEYIAGLRLAADNELLLDHQTGCHVQGMVVVEAIRQMFLAAFETGYRHRFPDRDYYTVWNGLDLEFRSFLFPLPALLRCVIESAALADPRRLDFTARVEITQAGQDVAAANSRFTAFDAARIGPAERRRARYAVESLTAAPAVNGAS